MPRGERDANLEARRFTSEFGLGEEVYLRQRHGEGTTGMIVGVTFTPRGEHYRVSWEDGTRSTHDAIELTREYIESEFTPEGDGPEE